MPASSKISIAIDAFWLILRGALDGIIYFSIRIYGIEDCTFQNIREGRYDNADIKPLNLDRAKDLDALLLESKALLGTANERRDVITDKCKTLLTLGSLLLAIIGALLPKSFAFSSQWMRIVCFFAILCLLISVVLLLVYFGIGKDQRLCLSQPDVELDSADLKKSLINEHLECEASTDNRTDYLADVYKVARGYFLVAFFTIVCLFTLNYFAPVDDSDAKGIVRQLRSSPDLIHLLQGPKGDKGDRGDQGQKGDKGDPGLSATAPSHGSTRP